MQGVIVATCTLGAMFGSLACSTIGDPLGRRKTIFYAAILTLIGEILECTSFHLAQFTIGRFIIGLGVGALSSTVPVWQSECSNAKNRGQHVVVDGLFICECLYEIRFLRGNKGVVTRTERNEMPFH